MDALIREHLPLARRIAGQIHRRLSRRVDREELESAAYVGLFEAARRFDHAQGVEFRTYAGHRIRGAVLDWLRDTGWWKRTATRKKLAPPIMSLDAACTPDGRPLLNFLAAPPDGEVAAREALEHLGRHLRPREQLALQMRAGGALHREIAETLGVGESYISQMFTHDILPAIAGRR